MTTTRSLRGLAGALVVLALALAPSAARADSTTSPTPSATDSATATPTDGASPGSGASTEGDPTSGADTLKFGLGPARAGPQGQYVDGRPYLNYVASPGATITDQVAVLNYGDKPLKLQMYATDAVQGTDGGFGLLPGGEKPKDAGSWVKLDVQKNGMVTVPPMDKKGPGQLDVPLSVTVPADATPGDHVGGVVASLKSTSTNAQGTQITLDQRIGIRTYFQVSGDLAPSLAVEGLKASYDDQHDPRGRGLVDVTYTVHNTGNMRLNAAQDLSVGRWLVGEVKENPPVLNDLLPGAKVVVHQQLPDTFGLGQLKATVTLHPTAVDTTYTQVVPDVSSSATFWAWPWVLIAIVAGVLVLLLLGFALWRRRRKRRRLAAASDVSSLVPRGPKAAKPAKARSGRRAARTAALGVAAVLGLGPAFLTTAAHATAPSGSLGEVILETGDATGVPHNAILNGWWGHEGGKGGNGTGTTYISMNAADQTGAVTDASVAALHKAIDDGGSFDGLRVAFVPYSADGSNERPHVTAGENVADAFTWFADMGMGTPLTGNTNKDDSVATVSTGAEYKAWWDAGRPLQGYTDSLSVVDIASDSTTTPAKAPQGKSILDRWPAGTKISMVLYESDGVDKDRPGLPTVAVGPDGRALSSWLTFQTVADPSDPSRSSAGYKILTGAGTGPSAPVPPGGGIQTGGATPSAGASGGTSTAPSGGADPSAAASTGSTVGSAVPSTGASAGGSAGADATTQSPASAADSDSGSSFPGGTGGVVVLILVVLAAAGAGLQWLRSRSRAS